MSARRSPRLLPFLACTLLAGCMTTATTPWTEPAAGKSATLRFEVADLTALRAYPDGLHCGAPWVLPADVDPLQREDRLMRLPADTPVALRLSWRRDIDRTCHALIGFTPAAGGHYRVWGRPDDAECPSGIEAIPGTHTPPAVTQPLREVRMTLDACQP
jgi:hypothetical protein